MSSRSTHFFPHLFRQRSFLILNLVLFLFLAFSFGREYLRNHQVQSSIALLEQQAQALEQSNTEIASLNAQLESEQFLEREARLRLGLVKPGERVIVVSDQETALTDIGGAKLSDPALNTFPQSLAVRWWVYFFDTERFDQMRLVERGRL